MMEGYQNEQTIFQIFCNVVGLLVCQLMLSRCAYFCYYMKIKSQNFLYAHAGTYSINQSFCLFFVTFFYRISIKKFLCSYSKMNIKIGGWKQITLTTLPFQHAHLERIFGNVHKIWSDILVFYMKLEQESFVSVKNSNSKSHWWNSSAWNIFSAII